MQFYENSNYKGPCQNKTILLDINSGGYVTKQPFNANADFDVSLNDNLFLSEEYEVYFESITSIGTNVNTGDNISFLLTFYDFNIQNGFNKNTNLDLKKIVIPNTCSTDGATSINKSKKINYICTMNSSKLRTIRGRITNIANGSMVNNKDGRVIIELLLKPKKCNKMDEENIELQLYDNTRYFTDKNQHLILDLESTTAVNNAPYSTSFSENLIKPITMDHKSGNLFG